MISEYGTLSPIPASTTSARSTSVSEYDAVPIICSEPAIADSVATFRAESATPLRTLTVS